MINLIIALPDEARPLIRHFCLQKKGYYSYDLYSDNNIRLITSGIGPSAAANACSWLQGLNESPDKRHTDAWLNIGIAGHKTFDIGTGLLAHSIQHQLSNQAWYPGFTFRLPCRTSALLTVDHPEHNYTDDKLYDMEAAGFYSACSRFSTTELIHSFKIVSDNQDYHANNINKSVVEKLLQNNLYLVEQIISILSTTQQQLAQLQQMPVLYDQCLTQWHFSHYQRKQLQQSLNRWHTLKGQQLWPQAFDHINSARQLLLYLDEQIAQHPVRIGS